MRKRKTKYPSGVRPRTDGSWQIRYQGIKPDGTRGTVSETIFNCSATEAGNLREQRRVEVRTGKQMRRSRMTVREFFEQYFAGRESGAIGKAIGSKTLRDQRALTGNHIYPRIGGLEMKKLDGPTLGSLYAEILNEGRIKGSGALSTTTVTLVHRIIHVAFKYAVLQRLLPDNPADQLMPPQAKRVEVKVVEGDGFERLVKAMASTPCLQRFYIPALLGGVMGMRRGEALGVKWPDIDFEKRELIVRRSLEATPLPKPKLGEKAPRPNVRLDFKSPKSGKARKLVIPRFVLEALRVHRIQQRETRLAIRPEQRQDHDLVVCLPDGSMWHPETFTPRFISAAKQAGFTIYFHMLRATAISRLIATGAHPKVVQEFAGHHSAGFTMDRYGHVAESLQREAAERIDAYYATLGQELSGKAG